MTVKRFLLLLPSLLIPYIAILTIAIIFFASDVPSAKAIMENVFQGNALLLSAAAFILILAAAACTVIAFALSMAQKWDPLSLAKTVMIIKLLQIPAFVLIFVVSILFMLTIFTIPFALVLFLVDYIALISTGLLNISAIVTGARNGDVSFRKNIWVAILQFVFCADVVASVIFYINLKKTKLNH